MPLTVRQWEESLRQPAFCELLPIRDYLDNVLVRTNGSFVAGYEAVGLNTFYYDDDTRNRTKETLESLVRSLPERSMRMQVRYEIGEGYGDLVERFAHEQRTENAILQALDRERIRRWRTREGEGHYLNRRLHFYFIWNPDIHHENSEFEWRKARKKKTWSLSADRCIQRAVREHQDLLSEFESLLAGIEATLRATGLEAHRMSDQELFLEVKRALQPLGDDRRPYKQSLAYESARSQAANVNIEDEQDAYLKIGGLLYSWVSLKEMPDATFPGIMRQLVGQEFPIVVSAEVTIPDQSRIMRSYKRRLLRMQAAQRDIHGGFKINVEAQVAQEQLIKTLQDVVSSSLKVCHFSLVAGLRISQPIRNSREREESERILADRRQRILHAVTRMNGGRAIPETLAQKRIFIGTLPGLAEETKRERECLTLHAADLLPVEVPWQGLTNSPVILLETPSRHMVPFSPFDPGLGDANLLIIAKSGGGKTFMAQLLLLMLARSNAQISILERGDSYRTLVELMGGRVIEVNLDGNETINPFDLPPGEKSPSKEKIAFLKNLTQYMIGASPSSDATLVENVLSDAIAATYKRCAMRYANPAPTFSDLRDELGQWRDEEKMQRAIDEARLASIKLRTWTESGIYSRLFDRHTNIRTDDNWLLFDVEGLSSDPKLEIAMSMLIAHAMSERASGRSGQPSNTVLDECWSLLDSPTLAPEVVQLFRTARKRNSSVWGISQTLEDFVGTSAQPRPHGPGIVKNANTKLIGQQPGDLGMIGSQLHLNEVALGTIKRFSSPQKGRYAEMLLVIGEKSETTQTVRLVPTPIDYWICTTYPRERIYRTWFLRIHESRPLLDSYEELAQTFPQGLAAVAPLPEEVSGAVNGREPVGVREPMR